MSDEKKETPPPDEEAPDQPEVDAAEMPEADATELPERHAPEEPESARTEPAAKAESDTDTSEPDEKAASDEEMPPGADDLDEDSGAMRALLRGAFEEEAEPQPKSDVLRGVQDKLRKRSGGKFYTDGWSTARHPPTMTYLWTGMIMLAIVAISYAYLASLSDEAREVHNEPAPVQIIHPKQRR